ncbi:MAG: SH3 domain-containing protein [Nitrolancea sp.]
MWLTSGRLGKLVAVLSLLVVTVGCGVPEVLNPSLPDSAGDAYATKSISQPFLSPSDGIDGLTIVVSPPTNASGALFPNPTGGATVTLRYAPEVDNRYPDSAFHDWPDQTKWLGELTGDRTLSQTFYSRYPNLNGVTLRVATFGADTGTGDGTLKSGPDIEMLALPIDGKLVEKVAGGTTVKVLGAAEGWTQVQLPDGQSGFISLDQFASLPDPSRSNTHDVTLTLSRTSDGKQLRQVTINASRMHDNSHVTFQFDPISDSDGQEYRFTLSSPESTPGNAVTFRYDPESIYAEGSRVESGKPANGSMVFRPTFAEGTPIFRGNLDDFEWSSLTRAFAGSFPAKSGTADRYLSVDLTPGTRSLNVGWSLIRPAGGQPIVVDGNSQSPGGGLIFNARYRGEVAAGGIVSDALRAAGHDVRTDPAFFTLYTLLLVAILAWGAVFGARRWLHGR